MTSHCYVCCRYFSSAAVRVQCTQGDGKTVIIGCYQILSIICFHRIPVKARVTAPRQALGLNWPVQLVPVVLPRCKTAGSWPLHPPTSRGETKERVEIPLLLSLPSWLVIRRNLRLPVLVFKLQKQQVSCL